MMYVDICILNMVMLEASKIILLFTIYSILKLNMLQEKKHKIEHLMWDISKVKAHFKTSYYSQTQTTLKHEKQS